MKFDKQLAIILVLLTMLLSAIAVSVYFYNQNKKTEESKNQLVTIFVAKSNLKKDSIIKDIHIKATTIARQYVLTKPLLRSEILNKHASETIYQNEAFLKEKLTLKIKKLVIKKTLDYRYNSYNMSLGLFQNPNFSLQPSDIIKIISVYPKTDEEATNDFSVQYVAKDIRVLGFMRDGYTSSKSIVKKKIKKLVKKKQVEEIIDLKADEIVLDIKQKVLLSLIDDYNKGKQLWMVKSRYEGDFKKDIEKEKKKLDTFVKDRKQAKKAKKKIKYKARSYPIKWYKPKNTTSTKIATISYANNNELSKTKKAKITTSFSNECRKTGKLLIVATNKTKLKNHPSLRAKLHKTIYKNYIVPYTSISKINPSWYRVCDGSYINSEDVLVITYDEYKKLK